VDHDTFGDALSKCVVAEMKRHGAWPILHFSMHGSENGIGLTDGTFFSWEDLREAFHALRAVHNFGVFACLSSCYGAEGVQMAMEDSEDEPAFDQLVCHPGEVGWEDAAVGFGAFYHRLFRDGVVEDAVAAMKIASGDSGFRLVQGSGVKRAFQDLWSAVSQAEVQLALSRLDQEVAGE
jgi:hypothetical protein